MGPFAARPTHTTNSTRCTFERIYFSRGNDPDIHRERINLGTPRADPRALGDDVHNAVFSFVPNTAETAAEGLARAATRFVSNTPINSGTISTRVRPNGNSWTPSWSPPSAWYAWPTKINACAPSSPAMPPAATWCSTFTTSPVIWSPRGLRWSCSMIRLFVVRPCGNPSWPFLTDWNRPGFSSCQAPPRSAIPTAMALT